MRCLHCFVGTWIVFALHSSIALPQEPSVDFRQRKDEQVRRERADATVKAAVVRIVAGTHAANGVIVSQEGHVVTGSPHILRHPGDPVIYLADGRRIKARKLGTSREFRIGMLQITSPGPWPHVELADQVDPTVGQTCISVGFDRRSMLTVVKRHLFPFPG